MQGNKAPRGRLKKLVDDAAYLAIKGSFDSFGYSESRTAVSS